MSDSSQSALYCGCDAGANHRCDRHKNDSGWTESEFNHFVQTGTTVTIPKPPANKNRATLPTEPANRKRYPIATGVMEYFPDAIAAIAHVSWAGNDQHNPGEPLHWARSKSMDQADTMLRHYLERGTLDKDGLRHTAKMAWRALAILQLEIEAELAK